MSDVSNNGRSAAKPRVLIVGAGYGGLRAALRLAAESRHIPGGLDIVLLDMNDYHQIITELHEVAGGRITLDAVRLSLPELLRGTGVRFVQARVTDFDFANNLVRVEQHREDGTARLGRIEFRWLVMALGSTTAFRGILGLKEHAFTLKSSWEAERVYRHVVAMFQEAAATPAADPTRRELLTLVIGGGGYTGVELGGEFAELVDKLCAEYQIPRDEVNLCIVEMQPRLLPGYEDWMAEYSAAALQRLGVTIMTGDGVREVRGDEVELMSGRRIKTRTMIWVGGVQAAEETSTSGGATGPGGRLAVNRYLQAVDYPCVYAIGDNGVQTEGQNPPPSAQVALQQANCVAHNIIAEAQSRPHRRHPFKADLAGEVISIGSKDGVATVRGLHITGYAASALKSLIERRYRLSLQSGPIGDLAMLSTFI